MKNKLFGCLYLRNSIIGSINSNPLIKDNLRIQEFRNFSKYSGISRQCIYRFYIFPDYFGFFRNILQSSITELKNGAECFFEFSGIKFHNFVNGGAALKYEQLNYAHYFKRCICSFCFVFKYNLPLFYDTTFILF